MKLSASDLLELLNTHTGEGFDNLIVTDTQQTTDGEAVITTVIVEDTKTKKLYSFFVASWFDDHGNKSVTVSAINTDIAVETYGGDLVENTWSTQIPLQEVYKITEVVTVTSYLPIS